MEVVCNKAEGGAIFQENEKFRLDGAGTLIDTFRNIVKHSCFKRDNCIWKFSNDTRVIHQRTRLIHWYYQQYQCHQPSYKTKNYFIKF